MKKFGKKMGFDRDKQKFGEFFWNEDSLFDDSKGIDDIENIRHRGTNYLAGKGEKKIWEYT